ncbi:hypothetical protein A0H81_01785 [Grifola frondosa]|uniref:LysM domain-containing protein n=1 Tax=Grifola frondosa TaxID=5627 RepID=A0A1C7MLJ6_GRIFR|nr:hypothetical protein A0H81_01785 [Grifola frondosa]
MFARAVIAAVLAAPFVAQSVFAADCSRTYTVQEGDWCDTISAAKNVSTYQLAVVNTGNIDSSCDNLQVGNTICLGTVGEDCTTTYVVKQNDSCDLIAQNYQLNTTILYTNNPQIDAECSNIYIGEVLCVAKSIAVPPPPAGSSLPAATIPATATPANAHPSTSASVPSSTSTDAGNDDDLPWCDEL